ncbi:hypothetical protein I6E87_001862 [Enterococcus faecalis]|nr:hypothetical protein [Enterococcus faecalis]EGO2834198.1 hypothetical protein [Enterococcus faecalis]EGQ7428287.1 hypothetical protein [Enterococcus faecalis]EJB2753245.1 hypothetical protein [Enterococcus faecalis]EKJ5046663.1 hypothetical protein [Enterococcus faecalis]
MFIITLIKLIVDLLKNNKKK